MAKTKEYDIHYFIQLTNMPLNWDVSNDHDFFFSSRPIFYSCLLFSRVLLKAIGSNIFNTIVDQVPYAIEDLKREIRQNAGEELDSCEESENNQDNEEKTQGICDDINVK